MPGSAVFDHIERVLADAYHREIEHEENVWRTLPFFAATLALQLTALFQTVEHLPPAGTAAWRAAVGFGIVSGATTFVALIFLAASIMPARFDYIAPEPDLLDFADRLDWERTEAGRGPEASIEPVETLKRELARQYALAAEHNRAINRSRAKRRSIAGLATILSVLATIALVTVIAVTYVPKLR